MRISRHSETRASGSNTNYFQPARIMNTYALHGQLAFVVLPTADLVGLCPKMLSTEKQPFLHETHYRGCCTKEAHTPTSRSHLAVAPYVLQENCLQTFRSCRVAFRSQDVEHRKATICTEAMHCRGCCKKKRTRQPIGHTFALLLTAV